LLSLVNNLLAPARDLESFFADHPMHDDDINGDLGIPGGTGVTPDR